ncbi:transketolase [Mobilicoccus pelagius]|uniref:Transketolase n=1 Tax=Mobilicoccus pelagius NBRC 104925 TaxID=1089455 RepID=H5UTN4_9MICO|nr:transketolase [Mobilicoccus pelagius]GAB49092.1 transketolase [Mobilicoccus pelagius NBRC 104925]
MTDQLTDRDPSLPAPRCSEVGWTDLDVRAVDTVRVLAADAVQKAGNGHPGTAMSLAPLAYLLFQNVMTIDPHDPDWLGRDRFVLSCGHSSLTQYLQLYLSGYGMEMDDLKALRTFGSQTPGHPEVHHTRGVEITTGPLGSGLATAVGMAMGQRRQRGMFDPDAPAGESPFDHHVYVIASDGDLMEGVSAEASSLAGHQELDNLTVIYDQNFISIEDDTDISFSEDVKARYEAYGWHVEVVDWRGEPYVEDVDALYDALQAGEKRSGRPTLVILRTVIAWPAPSLQGTGKSHGAALGEEEIAATKKLLGFDPEVAFPEEAEVLAHARKVADRGAKAHAEWEERFQAWRSAHPEAAATLDRIRDHELPEGLDQALPVFPTDAKGMATRKASGQVINAIKDVVPELWGGSADLAESNNTDMKGEPSFVPESRATKMWPGGPYGRNLHFGIRENAMGMALNGMALEGLTRPYGGTFLIFSDYMRPAVRLAALQDLGVTFVWTHDSVGLGEDGPTHQPIEHLTSLRAIPHLDVVRPADANETAWAWRQIIANHDRPAGLALSRQNLPVLDRDVYAAAENTTKGGYVLADTDGTPDVLLIASGSEVSLALAAREELAEIDVAARVVSMPCVEWFMEQPQEYRESVLPPTVRARVAVEAGHPMTWYRFVGDAGRVIGIDHFGASAAGEVLFEEFGFTSTAVVDAAKDSIEDARRGARVGTDARIANDEGTEK